MGRLEDRVKEIARELGFDAVGITSAGAFTRDEEASVERVRQGRLDGMAWITEDRMRRSARPRELLAGARSVISLAMSYYTGDFPDPQDEAPRGRVARYAWGDDYHNVMKRRLKELVTRLSEMVESPVGARFFVDDGPMLDRAAAQRAGIGWFGKSTNILTTTHGSWVFLAEVVTDLELEPDEPLKKSCGECVRCIDACPTGAIVAPYVIDAPLCISYLTIECRGPIPRRLRHLVGDWVFGCDVCQEVCPVNFKAEPGGEPAYRPRSGFAAPELIPLLELDEDAFRERFRNSPIRRAKLVGLRRNVCVALGNIGDAAAAPALLRALQEVAPLVRMHAAWALGRIGGSQAAFALERARTRETDPDVLEEIEAALSEEQQAVSKDLIVR